jgi:co-chaperonin GroES (HSP10)
MKVTGTIKPLGAKVFVSDMDFGNEKTEGGIFIPSSDGKNDGIVPRWGKVWAIGPDQTDVKIGEWLLIEHGRWTRSIEVEKDGKIIKVRMIDVNDVMIVTNKKPNSIYRRLN